MSCRARDRRFFGVHAPVDERLPPPPGLSAAGGAMSANVRMLRAGRVTVCIIPSRGSLETASIVKDKKLFDSVAEIEMTVIICCVMKPGLILYVHIRVTRL